MTILLLIRHGQTSLAKRGVLAGRRPGVHLTDDGRSQAIELANSLASLPIKALYSSPLERAVETARPISRALGMPMRREAGLLEADVGKWQGKSIGRLARTRQWQVVQRAPSRARHPSGESFLETQVRVVSALEKICARHKPRDVVACVFHSDPIKLAVAHYIGLPLDRFQQLACDTASVTLLAVTESSAQLLWLNRHPPLGPNFVKKSR
jgi:probable phosphomutase (TIGR03848 family)